MSDERQRTAIKPSSLKSLKSSIKPLSNPEGRTTTIGESFAESKVALDKKARANHTHIIGSTGTGKSKLIELLIRQDITDRNCGLCLIDPHGSLYDEVVAYVAQSPTLADRFILFNPAAEHEQIVGFNPIPADITHFDYTLSTLISACLKAWGQDNTDSTPRISRWLRNVFYPILAKRLTLLESAPLVDVYSKTERGALLANIENSLVIGDWMMFEALPLTQKQQQIEGAANRLQKFLSNEIIRNIIGQGSRTLDFARILGEGKILLVNLSGGGKISYENAQLLGIMMVNEIFRVAKLRDPRDSRLKPFYLYIDEFGQFITRDIARALEECRKYKLFLILAHQHLAQLKQDDEYLYASVLTNCKNKIVFGGLSKEDADVMTDEVSTGFLDLKKIKDEVYSTKVHHIEETRVVRGVTSSVTKGTNTNETVTQSESLGETAGESFTKGTGRTENTGESQSKGTSQTLGKATTRGTQRGTSDGRTETHGTNESQTESESRGTSHTQSRSESETAGSGQRDGDNAQHFTQSYGTTSGAADTDSQSRSTSRARGSSHSNAVSHTDSFSESESLSDSVQQGTNESTSINRSTGISTNESRTESKSTTRTIGTSRGVTKGSSESITEGVTETVVPFLRQEEYAELSSRTFWTRDELHYMELAAMKNQDTGEAFIKIGASAPVRVKVQHVQSVPYSPRLTPKRVNTFLQKVFEKNSRYYTPLLEVRIEYEERQRRIFGEPLRFDETPSLPRTDNASEAIIEIEGRVLSYEERLAHDEQDPFG